MKANGSSIKRRIGIIVTALVSTLLVSGTIQAFAYPLDHDGSSGPVAPVSAGATGGGNSWIIALIVVAGVAALTAALIGTVRLYRSRARTVAAGV
jgi:hypothetical protein